jgi:nitrate reductase gamma subunit
LLWWVWIGVVVFVLGCLVRALKYARAPLHLRWDLYPVAHEPRRDHGGSYLEEKDWWTKPRVTSLWGEAFTMFEEIVLLKGVWENNRKVWYGSLPFHWGLYLLVLTTFGLVIAGLGLTSPVWIVVLSAAGGVGGILTALGALILLIIRASDAKLRPYTATTDRLNLLLLVAVGALSAVAAIGSPGMARVSNAVHDLMRLQSPQVTPLLAWQMGLAALFVFYMPFTRMIHMFAKYFTYHQVRWDDRPVKAGTPMEKRLRAALDFGVTWSADHIRTGKTWAEVATSPPPAEDDKKGE